MKKPVQFHFNCIGFYLSTKKNGALTVPEIKILWGFLRGLSYKKDPLSVLLIPRVFLLGLVDLGLLHVLGGIPALFLHFVVDLLLHLQGTGERRIENASHLGGGGFDGAVKVEIPHALGGQEKALHEVFVVHVVSFR
jgi:hypothetical protein